MQNKNGLLKAGYILNYIAAGITVIVSLYFIAIVASGNFPYPVDFDPASYATMDATVYVFSTFGIAFGAVTIFFTIKASKDDKFNLVAGILGIFVSVISGVLILVGNSSQKNEL